MAEGRRVSDLPSDALVLLIGPAGSGKSTFAAQHFDPHEVLSTDAYREMISDDAADQSATADAVKVLDAIVWARLRRGLLSVVDATNLTVRTRRSLSRLAARASRPCVAIVFDVTLEHCLAQNGTRRDRQVPEEVVRRHHRELQVALEQLPNEGYASILVLRDAGIDPGLTRYR